MGQINYDAIATTYAQTRDAVPWVVTALEKHLQALPAGRVIIELGCGTGNHIRALAERIPQHDYRGFDQSGQMLKQAQALTNAVSFTQGDAQQQWPYPDQSADLVFNVDVIHYIQALPPFFSEAKRVLKREGTLLIVTDAEDDLHKRSLTHFFPESLAYELARYPTAQMLQSAAINAGLTALTIEKVTGIREINDEYIARMAAKCSSALRLISEEAHQQGLTRLREAQARGEQWHSLYTIYHYTNNRSDSGVHSQP